MHVLIVYCHPSSDSFTCRVKESFIEGLKAAGHTFEISDLYAMGFDPVMKEAEYLREAYYRADPPVPAEVRAEQEKIDRCDALVFIYPDFWTASPALLEGWFQRVLTYGYAYGPAPSIRPPEKALFLVTMGGCLAEELRRTQLEAMKTVMLGDRISWRAKRCELYAFDEMSREKAELREQKAAVFLKKA